MRGLSTDRPQVLASRLSTFPLSLSVLTLKSTSILLSPRHTVVDVLVVLSASVPLLLLKVMMEVMTTTSRRLWCYQDGIPMYIWLAILVKQQFFPLSILLVHALAIWLCYMLQPYSWHYRNLIVGVNIGRGCASVLRT